LNIESTKIIEDLEKKSNTIINHAQQIAESIEQKARQTARGISVEEAQKQFQLATKPIIKQIWVWASLSTLFSVLFIGIIISFIFESMPEVEKWGIIYYTAIRITFLSAIGAIAGFCLKLLRAHLHMYNHNLHRQRIANSIEAFVESAELKENRDLILLHLVDAIAQFGDSGLVQKEDDSIHSTKMIFDNISKYSGGSK
jgi:hypothetical protein